MTPSERNVIARPMAKDTKNVPHPPALSAAVARKGLMTDPTRPKPTAVPIPVARNDVG